MRRDMWQELRNDSVKKKTRKLINGVVTSRHNGSERYVLFVVFGETVKLSSFLIVRNND